MDVMGTHQFTFISSKNVQGQVEIEKLSRDKLKLTNCPGQVEIEKMSKDN